MTPAYSLHPVFILGASPRSGTNCLRNLLVLHPAIGNGRVVWEDFLLVVRFEDLFRNSKRELENIFSFLDVSAKEYDFHAAENLPISGSFEMAKKKSEVHWEF